MDLRWMRVTYGVLDHEVSPPPHKVTSCDMRDSFAFSPCVDARWLCVPSTAQSHLTWHMRQLWYFDLASMRGDFGGQSKCSHHLCFGHHRGNISPPTKSPHIHVRRLWYSHLAWMRGGCEVTYGVLDRKVSPPSHKVTLCDMWDNFGILDHEVPPPPHKSPHATHETTLPFSPCMDVRWLMGFCEVSSPPHKVTLHDMQDSFAFSSCVDVRWLCVPSTAQSHLMRHTRQLWHSHHHMSPVILTQQMKLTKSTKLQIAIILENILLIFYSFLINVFVLCIFFGAIVCRLKVPLKPKQVFPCSWYILIVTYP